MMTSINANFIKGVKFITLKALTNYRKATPFTPLYKMTRASETNCTTAEAVTTEDPSKTFTTSHVSNLEIYLTLHLENGVSTKTCVLVNE